MFPAGEVVFPGVFVWPPPLDELLGDEAASAGVALYVRMYLISKYAVSYVGEPGPMILSATCASD